jgi:nucleoside-diphosphate-sugar epimerase
VVGCIGIVYDYYEDKRGVFYVKVLVAGAAGFLGGHLVDMLVERGDEVRAMVRPVEDASHLRTLKHVEIVNGDLTDAESLKRAVQGVQRVYNVAAKTGPWGLEAVYKAINVWGVVDLISAAMEAGVERIVHTSSITVYGHHLNGIVTEDYPYSAEDNPYSRTKIEGEKVIANLVKERGAPVVIVRPAWIYGPRDNASFGRFVSLVESGKGFFVGSGKNIVPSVYVRDVAQGLIKAGDAGNEVIGRVAELVWQALGRRNAVPPPVTTYGITLLGGDQQFSIDRARKELGYEPTYDIKHGIEEGVRWYLEAKRGKQQLPTTPEVVQAKG